MTSRWALRSGMLAAVLGALAVGWGVAKAQEKPAAGTTGTASQQATTPQPAPAGAQVQPQPQAPGGATAPSPAPGGTVSTTPVVGKRSFRPQPPPATFSPPILEIDQADFDWGTALQGELVRHTFKLTNRGGAPLNVLQVKPSCGCTTAAKPDRPIDPGQSGEVTLEIDTKKFSGQIKKTADLLTNAGSAPSKLSMGGKVEPFFTAEPPNPKLDVVRGMQAETVKVKLRRSAKAEFKVKEAKVEGKVVSATLAEVQPGELYEVSLQANLGDNPGKYYSEQLHVKLDAGGKEFDIPILISVSVKDRIDVQPRNSVYFSRNETKQLAQAGSAPVIKPLDIKSLAGAEHTFKITEVKQETQSFETKIETVVEGKHYRLNISMSKMPADTKSRTLRDTIVVLTDDPTIKELKVTALAALQ